jgi:hypothetical protein
VNVYLERFKCVVVGDLKVVQEYNPHIEQWKKELEENVGKMETERVKTTTPLLDDVCDEALGSLWVRMRPLMGTVTNREEAKGRTIVSVYNYEMLWGQHVGEIISRYGGGIDEAYRSLENEAWDYMKENGMSIRRGGWVETGFTKKSEKGKKGKKGKEKERLFEMLTRLYKGGKMTAVQALALQEIVHTWGYCGVDVVMFPYDFMSQEDVMRWLASGGELSVADNVLKGEGFKVDPLIISVEGEEAAVEETSAVDGDCRLIQLNQKGDDDDAK